MNVTQHIQYDIAIEIEERCYEPTAPDPDGPAYALDPADLEATIPGLARDLLDDTPARLLETTVERNYLRFRVDPGGDHRPGRAATPRDVLRQLWDLKSKYNRRHATDAPDGGHLDAVDLGKAAVATIPPGDAPDVEEWVEQHLPDECPEDPHATVVTLENDTEPHRDGGRTWTRQHLVVCRPWKRDVYTAEENQHRALAKRNSALLWKWDADWLDDAIEDVWRYDNGLSQLDARLELRYGYALARVSVPSAGFDPQATLPVYLGKFIRKLSGQRPTLMVDGDRRKQFPLALNDVAYVGATDDAAGFVNRWLVDDIEQPPKQTEPPEDHSVTVKEPADRSGPPHRTFGGFR